MRIGARGEQCVCLCALRRMAGPGLHWQGSSGEQRLPRLWREGRSCFEVGATNAGIAYQGGAFVHPPNPSFERTPNSYAVGRRSSQTLGPSQKCVLPAIRRLGSGCCACVVPTSCVKVAANLRLSGVVTSGEFLKPRLARVCTGTVASVNQATAKVVH